MSIGLSIPIRPLGKSTDAGDLFYALKAQLLEWTWNVTSTLTGFHAYLATEELDVYMADRWADQSKHDPTSLWFAFWDQDVDSLVVEYVIHIAEGCILLEEKRLAALAKKHGFALDRAAFRKDHPRRGRFAMHSAQRVCRVLPWRRGQAVTDAPTFACGESVPHRAKAPSPRQVVRMRAAAMTGMCACKFCFYQFKPDLLSAKIADAWAVLDADRKGAALAKRVASNEPVLVMSDWLEERGVVLVPEQVAAIAAAYATAPSGSKVRS